MSPVSLLQVSLTEISARLLVLYLIFNAYFLQFLVRFHSVFDRNRLPFFPTVGFRCIFLLFSDVFRPLLNVCG